MSCTENLIDLTIILYYMYAALPRNSQTGWLYSSVSWPNRNPAVPFSHWFLTPDVLPPPPPKGGATTHHHPAPFPKAHWIGWFAPQGWELEGYKP